MTPQKQPQPSRSRPDEPDASQPSLEHPDKFQRTQNENPRANENIRHDYLEEDAEDDPNAGRVGSEITDGEGG